jgi:hypothetical protein
VVELGSLPKFEVLATPISALTAPRLLVEHSSYSENWRGPAGSQHVVVDGLINGWVLNDSRSFVVAYEPDTAVRTSFVVSALALAAVLGLTLSVIPWRRLRGFLPRNAMNRAVNNDYWKRYLRRGP